ncbi:Nicotinate-nucleotide--dimethylbenzimidazole phosphoribosyltransferase [Fusobacterium sp. DD29]|nr:MULTISPECIES: nicotinate-nucleotide--dimethylbenzimidazole phosphoribosyltransferase [unclassified Fusobacterium]MBR8749055.1 Nicotinate-nucleotide--dimethylbenzimidazole phosphoribosyltransferase [Fusobacterium sp. DD29]MBR8761321.1 Nicotinate-nucleotide--dimethylbenzimidazole phosphoribosyltransferase [Fusobacterium sp. DD25]MBR8767326.1 Nicotinate-nucleotide--dimethylbenzimidazole phosphoribosyltransferase [Fusobacterium sp. DD43]MBR8771376.1 Nicotinate-nucleotide--dimethylbenzimidazole p
MLGNISGLDEKSVQEAQDELNRKMKPQGSLGILEKIAIQMAGIYGFPVKGVEKKCHIVASADNGVIEEGISSCPLEYTQIVSEAMLNRIAAIGLLTKRLGVEFNLVDIGIAGDIPREYPNLYRLKVKKGTKNFYREPAMTREECLKAIQTGMDMIKDKGEGVTVFSNGEMGIGNTSTSSAVLYSFTRGDIDSIVGRGGGLSDSALVKKKKIIIESCEKYNTFEMDPVDVLAHVGGLDIACMVGMYLGCVKYRKLMLVDGFISAVGALAACRIEPLVKEFILPTHMSEEPGMKIVLNEIGKKAFLNMEMRLGEGTGAVLTYPMIDCALDVINGMKTPVEVYKLFS